MAFEISVLVYETFLQLSLAIALSKLIVAVTIKAYIDRLDNDAIASTISAACLPCLPLLLNGLTNSFTGLE